jgi:hypothetical protein
LLALFLHYHLALLQALLEQRHLLGRGPQLGQPVLKALDLLDNLLRADTTHHGKRHAADNIATCRARRAWRFRESMILKSRISSRKLFGVV